MRYIKLIHVGFRAHVKIASRIVSYGRVGSSPVRVVEFGSYSHNVACRTCFRCSLRRWARVSEGRPNRQQARRWRPADDGPASTPPSWRAGSPSKHPVSSLDDTRGTAVASIWRQNWVDSSFSLHTIDQRSGRLIDTSFLKQVMCTFGKR